MPLPSLDPPIPAGTATALAGVLRGLCCCALPPILFSWVRACEVDKKDTESPSGDKEDLRGISNPVAIVLTLGILGVVVLLSLFVMGLIFIFQSVL